MPFGSWRHGFLPPIGGLPTPAPTAPTGIAASIANLATATQYTVTRRSTAVPAYDDATGLLQQVAPTTLEIVAVVVPMSGRDLLRLPEGRRAVETRTIYTASRLYVDQQQGSRVSDTIEIAGVTFEVQTVREWIEPGGAVFYEAVAQATI
jgi:hypothetical protein